MGGDLIASSAKDACLSQNEARIPHNTEPNKPIQAPLIILYIFKLMQSIGIYGQHPFVLNDLRHHTTKKRRYITTANIR
jgi:hypothetical protein